MALLANVDNSKPKTQERVNDSKPKTQETELKTQNRRDKTQETVDNSNPKSQEAGWAFATPPSSEGSDNITFSQQNNTTQLGLTRNSKASSSFSSFLLSSQELSDTKFYEPQIRALLGTL